MINCFLNRQTRISSSVFLISGALLLASCATKKSVEPAQSDESKVVRSFAPVKQADQQLVSELIEGEEDDLVQPTVATIQNSDPLLNGQINSQTAVEGAAVKRDAIVNPLAEEIQSSDEKPLETDVVEAVSEDDQIAVKKLIENTEPDDDLCIVTVENDCSADSIE